MYIHTITTYSILCIREHFLYEYSNYMSTEGVFAVCMNIILDFYTLNGKKK